MSALCMLIQGKVSKLPVNVQASGIPVTFDVAFIITATKSSLTLGRGAAEPYGGKNGNVAYIYKACYIQMGINTRPASRSPAHQIH